MATSGTVQIEEREEDVSEKEKLEEFCCKGCGCQRGLEKGSCSKLFPASFLQEHRDNCHALSDEQLDLIILGQLASHRRYPGFVQQYHNMRPHRKVGDLETTELEKLKQSFRHSTKYFIHDIPICETTFCFLYAISGKRLRNLQVHLDQNGLVPRTHGLTGIPPKNSFGADCIQDVVTFIRSIAEVRSIAVPGRLPGVDNISSIKLPSDMSKASIYKEYVEATSKTDMEPVSLSTFKAIWLKYIPEISFMRPQTDLCHVCQENSILVQRSAGMPDKEKESRYSEALKHLQKAEVQRNYYNNQCDQAKEQVQQEQVQDPITYSFDFAQNITYPHSSQQVGPAYFKTARRCGVFGVLCEGTGVQTNYLIDECDTVGKGANAVISMLDHQFEHSEGARKLQLHADNCTGQNKNNAVLQYLMWRVMSGKNDDIELSFMMPGHTKFGPDRMFGLIKKRYYKTQVDTLDDIVQLVSSSTQQKKNQAILTYDYVREKREVIWRDWSSLLCTLFRPLPGVLKFQHIRVEKQTPFKAFMRTSADADEQVFDIQKENLQHILDAGMPQVITPDGLQLSRQWYLYEEVRCLCHSEIAKSLTCPRPDLPKPSKKRRREE